MVDIEPLAAIPGTVVSISALVTPGGDIGLTGADGVTGPAGPQGATGAAGPMGAPGPTGAVGPQGPVGPPGTTWKGTWDSARTFAPGDIVYFNGTSYIATAQSAGAGAQPPNTAYWQTLASQGATGPTGPQGPQGPTGPTGATGPAGQGVVAGGATGQVLTKRTNADYDTQWTTPVAAGAWQRLTLASGWQIGTTGSNAGIRYRLLNSGKQIELAFDAQRTAAAGVVPYGNSSTLGTLPAGTRPPLWIGGMVGASPSSGTDVICGIEINTDGTVGIWATLSDVTWVWGTVILPFDITLTS